MSKVWIVIGSVPWESQDPIAAFSTEKDARAFCAKLEARRKRYEDAQVRFYTKLDLLKETMSMEEAWSRAGKEPQCPKDDWPEYYVEGVAFHAKAAS
ncbi:hypothetical protein [Ferrimicrobium acidiphilum]|uniref:Uncharacterized protein n=1 Tax=Ferrimicrobium acidiphilum DSM 19497 TaxID=1121877 RepID=A0A0D8FVL1_9ACTN|nr:hypothetical protein [Ferrimicrobium acidiphilum]KJE76277.1 hypothetical protein FEAC_20120 [Ferrimicrobium acidiphilum DSM 19497]